MGSEPGFRLVNEVCRVGLGFRGRRLIAEFAKRSIIRPGGASEFLAGALRAI